MKNTRRLKYLLMLPVLAVWVIVFCFAYLAERGVLRVEAWLEGIGADAPETRVDELEGRAEEEAVPEPEPAKPEPKPDPEPETVASGDTKPYVGTKDIVMVPSIVDVAGVNVISAEIYSRAVGAIVGMMETNVPKIESKPLIAASMFGNTTQLINQCKDIMERADYEVMVFHATGTGGMTMEDLIENGYFVAALDLTTTELADELCGGVMSAGPKRLTTAGLKGIPQVVAPGCLDMVNFWAIETVPERYKNRKLYPWNPNVTLMRTTPEENAKLGQIMAQRLNQSKGPTSVFFPLKGLSQLDSPGGDFWWPEADMALLNALKENLRKDIPFIEVDANINDPEFAKVTTDMMLEFLAK